MTVNTGTGPSDGNTFNNLFSFAWHAVANAQLTANLRNATITNTGPMVAGVAQQSHRHADDSPTDRRRQHRGGPALAQDRRRRRHGRSRNNLPQNGASDRGTGELRQLSRYITTRSTAFRGRTFAYHDSADHRQRISFHGRIRRGQQRERDDQWQPDPRTDDKRSSAMVTKRTSRPAGDATRRLTLGGNVMPVPGLLTSAPRTASRKTDKAVAGGEVPLPALDRVQPGGIPRHRGGMCRPRTSSPVTVFRRARWKPPTARACRSNRLGAVIEGEMDGRTVLGRIG